MDFSGTSSPSGNADATAISVMNARLRLVSSIGTLGVLLLVGAASVSGRVAAEEKCADAKAKASALAVLAQTRCQAKAVKNGTAVEAKCLSKAESKLRESFLKADAKGVCPGDAEVALAAASACATTFSNAVSGDARCAAKKLKAMGVKARAKAACARKAAVKGPEKGAACLENAEASFAKAVVKAEKKAACTGTADELEALVDACVVTLPPPRTCSGSGWATCSGSCPDGLTCRPYEVFADGASVETGCSCVDASNGPECGEPACSTEQHCPDPGFVCEQWVTGDPLECDHTICQPAMVTPTTLPPGPENTNQCDGGEFPTCGGTCPDGGRCQAFEGFLGDFAGFAGCLCVDPRGPRCESTTECNLDVLPFSHCADPSLTCLVTVVVEDGDKIAGCSDAHCGAAVPTTTSTSTTTSTTASSSSTTTTSTSTSTTTTVPCTSTPGVSGCFEDLGDCTILDHCTGLQWEQKSMTPGPHHVDNRYVWAGCCEDGCQTLCQPNAAAAATCMAQAEAGTVGCGTECPVGTCYVGRAGAVTSVWDWINQLNAQSFAGHDDWRLATEAGFNPSGGRELESILLQPCTGAPCIHPIFGPTASARYWSRTGDVLTPVDAWFVDFVGGGYSNLNKREPLYVRAVRSGS